MPDEKPQIYLFDDFELDLTNRRLVRDGLDIPLPSKAFDMLVVLLRNGGQLVGKDELFHQVWPGQVVEESNLTVQVSSIRKALGDRKENPRYITTVPGHGYRFTGQLRQLHEEEEDVVIGRHSIVRIENGVETAIQTIGRKPLPEHSRKRPISILFGLLAIATVLLVVGYFWLKQGTKSGAPATGGPSIKSIAVLPFKPLATDNRDEALELGMADALITKLSNMNQLVVRPTGSILKYQGLDQDPLTIGREQKVELLLEGKVQRSGDSIRVTVQLLRVNDGLTLWAGKFDEKFTNVFSVQDSISRQVAEALVLQLSSEQQQRLAKRYTDNIEAYNLYLKGRFFWNRFTDDGLKKSIEYFKQAIALDSNYALAHTGLSAAYAVQGAFGIVPPGDIWVEARRTAQRAVELDDSLAEAHTALGSVKLLYEWDWPAAEKEIKRAIELNPNYGEAHSLYGYYLWVGGDFDRAHSEIKRAQDLSPISPIITLDLATMFYYQGKYDQAIETYRKVQELDPNMLGPIFVVGQIYERDKKYDQAIEECQRALSAFGRQPAIISALGYVYGVSGNRKKAQDIVNELETMWKARYFSPLVIALVHAGMGNKDGAFLWLTRAYESRDPQLTWLMVEPQFDSLRSEPRFRALLGRMGIKSANRAPISPGSGSSSLNPQGSYRTERQFPSPT